MSDSQDFVDSSLKKRKRAALYIMTFIMGGCGLAYEYTFSKLSSDLLGNSVYQWAITIGLMMFFMGIGSDLQKHLKDERLFDKFIIFEVMLGVVGGFGPIILLWIFGISRDHYVLIQYSLIISTGFLIGMEIPILARINEKFTSELKVNIGGILRMDYIGAFAGAVLWAMVFIPFFELTRIGFVLGTFNLIIAGLSILYFRDLAYRGRFLSWLVIICASALFCGWFMAPKWTAYAEQRLYMDKVVYSESSRYQHIVMTMGPTGELLCFINGNTQFSSFDEHIYHEFLVHPALAVAPSRKNVLVLGGGDGLAVREILKYDDVAHITLVDLDPEMTRLAAENPYLSKLNQGSLQSARLTILENNALIDAGPLVVTAGNQNAYGSEREPTATVQVLNLDASLFVDQIQGYYDVIIIDFPDPNNLELAKLYSKNFYRHVRSRLTPGGIMVQQATSPVFTREAFLCIGRTINASGLNALPFHENVPSFGEWGWWIATRDDGMPPHELKHRLQSVQSIDVPVRYITPELIRASLVFGKNSLKTKQNRINTITNNVIHIYYADNLTAGY